MDKTFKLVLLPYFFKKIGFAFLILTVVLTVSANSFSIPVWNYISVDKEIFKAYNFNILLLSMYFIAMSKEKIEDEMTEFIRLNIISNTFNFLLSFFILGMFWDTYDGTLTVEKPIRKTIFFMLIFYLMEFYRYKWKAKRAEKKSQQIEA